MGDLKGQRNILEMGAAFAHPSVPFNH